MTFRLGAIHGPAAVWSRGNPGGINTGWRADCPLARGRFSRVVRSTSLLWCYSLLPFNLLNERPNVCWGAHFSIPFAVTSSAALRSRTATFTIRVCKCSRPLLLFTGHPGHRDTTPSEYRMWCGYVCALDKLRWIMCVLLRSLSGESGAGSTTTHEGGKRHRSRL